MEKEKEMIGSVNIETVNILLDCWENGHCREKKNSGGSFKSSDLKDGAAQDRMTEKGITLCMDEIAKDVSEKTGVPLGTVRQVFDAETEVLVKIGAAKLGNNNRREEQAKNEASGFSNLLGNRTQSSGKVSGESASEEKSSDEQEEHQLTEIFTELEPYLDLFKEGQTVRIIRVKKPAEEQKGDDHGKES